MMRPFALTTLALALALPACVKVDPLDPTLLTLTNTLTSVGTDTSGTAGSTDGDPTSDGTGTATSTTDDPTTGVPMTASSEPATSTTGMTSGSSSGAGSSSGGGGMPGEFGACQMMDPPCVGEADCLMITDVEGTFCSPKCATDADCPAPPDGAAMPACVLGMMMGETTNCALICDPKADNCPMGSSCKPIQGVGICTYP